MSAPPDFGLFVVRSTMGTTRATPVSQRNLTGIDFFLLWSGAAVSLAEIWAGGTLVGAGFMAAATAILLGHLIGNTPLALGGVIGSRHGISTMLSVRPSFGVRGAHFAAVLNVIQLIGWTAVMLIVAGNAMSSLVPAADFRVWAVVCGIITTLWALAGHGAWKWLQRISVSLLLILCVVMTYLVVSTADIRSIIHALPARENPMGFGLALDLVIAMPISWLPLVSDYSRFAVDTKRAFRGTWIGYFLVGSWMYLLGLVTSLSTGTTTPDAMIITTMGILGLAVPAVLVVVFSTVTTTFLDIYSAAVSSETITSLLRGRRGVLLTGAVGTILALIFPVQNYEGFLLLIGSVFCPLFGVVLLDYFVIRKGRVDTDAINGKGPYWYTGGFNIPAFIAWGAGFGLYHLVGRFFPDIGASIPAMACASLVYWAVMRKRGRETI
jgi:putative hydroxymethylpyrimidine transporter CytX